MTWSLSTTLWATTIYVRHKGIHGQSNTYGHALNEHTHLLSVRSTKYGYFESFSDAIIHSYF
jgi:hypothetical protein